MSFKPITLKSIAQELKLSVSTVSKALRGSYEISEETKKAVLEYATRHNYKPNPIALSLKKGRSKSLGVVISNIDNNFFSQVINGIESIAHEHHYTVIITQSKENRKTELQNLEHLASRSIDGLLISVSAETSDNSIFLQLREQGIPMVFFDRTMKDVEAHSVISNNYQGTFDATKYLLGQGYRRIGHLTSSSHLSITRERLQGYEDAMKEAGVAVNPDYIFYCEHGGMLDDEVERGIKLLLTQKEPPQALITASDRLSTKSIAILRKKGIDIPGQIAIVGFTNSTNADIFYPPLTRIVQPAFDIGKKATELLIQQIESKRPVTSFERIVFDTQLVLRASS